MSVALDSLQPKSLADWAYSAIVRALCRSHPSSRRLVRRPYRRPVKILHHLNEEKTEGYFSDFSDLWILLIDSQWMKKKDLGPGAFKGCHLSYLKTHCLPTDHGPKWLALTLVLRGPEGTHRRIQMCDSTQDLLIVLLLTSFACCYDFCQEEGSCKWKESR